MKQKRARPAALVAYESHHGHTEQIARAVMRGLRQGSVRAELVDAAGARRCHLDSFDLLVVGAPTHALAPGPHLADPGLREWLSCLPASPRHRLGAAFDTRVDLVRPPHLSAAVIARNALRHRGYRVISRPQAFLMEGECGPLVPDELDRAVSWGQVLARATREELAADSAAARLGA